MLKAVNTLYAPILGKCSVSEGYLNLDGEGEKSVLKAVVKPLNRERQAKIDGEPVRYDIGDAIATVDFAARTCTVRFKKFWIGGEVEREEVTFPITWSERHDEETGLTEVTVRPENGEEVLT